MERIRSVLLKVTDEWPKLVGTAAWNAISFESEIKDNPEELIDYALGITNDGRDLLHDKEKRNILIRKLNQSDASELVYTLNLSIDSSPYKVLCDANYNHDRRMKLYEFFGVPIVEELTMGDLSPFEVVQPIYYLHDYQKDVLIRSFGLYKTVSSNPEDHNFMIHMPTGSGKTRVAMNLISRVLMEQKKAIVLWMAYSEELCEQALSEFKKVWSAIGDRDLIVGRLFGKHDYNDIDDGLLVVGLDKLRARSKKDSNFIPKLSKKICLIVFDEAHQAVAPTYYDMLDEMKLFNPSCCLIGLSATPGRVVSYETNVLSNLFGNKKVTLNIPGFSSPISYLYQEGYLSIPTFTQIIVDVEFEVQYDKLDYSSDLLKKVGANYSRNLLICSQVYKAIDQGHMRIIIFAASVEGAQQLASMLSRKGIEAIAISSETDADLRAKRISRFKSEDEKPIVICNYGVLTTGFDAPKTTMVIVARPTESLILYSQMVGRALRGIKMGGTQTAEIVTFVDVSLPGYGSVVEAFRNWDEDWNEQ